MGNFAAPVGEGVEIACLWVGLTRWHFLYIGIDSRESMHYLSTGFRVAECSTLTHAPDRPSAAVEPFRWGAPYEPGPELLPRGRDRWPLSNRKAPRPRHVRSLRGDRRGAAGA